MLDLSANVTWREILAETEAGNIPHCRAVSAPAKYHPEIIGTLSRMILGTYRPSHPDLLVIGTPDKAPATGEYGKPSYDNSCRWLIDNIALKPLESTRRFAVIQCADKLTKPAGNSLLKLAEEPPSYAYLLFLMEDGNLFLPTLRSRSRFSKITDDERIPPEKIPADGHDWAEWLKQTRKSTGDNDTITPELEAWSNYALDTGNIDLAEKCENLRLISSRKNLSVPIMCDVIMLSLMEENEKIEHIFDDIRKA